jgi:DNA-binding MarR family transcriptional regulator
MLVLGRMSRRLQTATAGVLSQGLLSALAMVNKHGPLRVSDLAQLEAVSAPTMTRTLAELESRGYIVRHADPDDGRVVLVEASEAGAVAVQEARAARALVVEQMLTHLSPDELNAVMAALPALERLIEPS